MAKSIFGLTIMKKRNYDALIDREKKLKQDLTKSNEQNEFLEDQNTHVTKQKDLAIREMNEYQSLADSYLKDQKEAETKFSELQKILAKSVKSGVRLSKIEDKVIQDLIPPFCDTPPRDKIRLGNDSHRRPRGYEKFLEKISNCPYVSGIIYINTVSHGTTKLVRNESENGNGHNLTAVYMNKSGLKFEVQTTATDDFQTHFVINLLKKELKLS